MKVNYKQIRTDGGTQPRAELLIEVMEDYAEQMRASVKFPPITVFFDGKEYWLADGFHRAGAHVRAFGEDTPLEADVIQGTQSDAQWYSFGANRTHGLRRTNEDKERAVRTALQHPRAADLSNYQIADHCGVNEKTIRNYRKQLDATTEIPQSDPLSASMPSKSASSASKPKSSSPKETHPRTGRDGRTINTAKIGPRRRRKAQKPRSPAEFIEARRNGYRGRPSSMVKLEIPNNHVHNCAYDLLRHFTFEYLQKVFQEIAHIHQEHAQKEKSK